jgi:hypothetical protein
MESSIDIMPASHEDRKRALWTGSFAAYSALEIAFIVYFPYVVGSFVINIAWLVVGSALLFVLIAWISSTVKVVMSLDPFHRNRMKWRQSEKWVWLVSGIIVAMNGFSALVLLGYINYVSWVRIFGYFTVYTLCRPFSISNFGGSGLSLWDS